MINLYRAVRSAHLNQAFAENNACCQTDANGKPLQPFKVLGGIYPATCPIGSVKFYEAIGMKGHNGRDWMAYHGEPVYFAATDGSLNPIAGTCYTEVDSSGGIGVDIIFQDPVSLAWKQLKLWHLLKVNVFDGQVIKSGDCIGWADNTGASGGDHLHDGFKPLNSSNLEDKQFPNNGYTGAIDPATDPDVHDFQASSFILDVLNLNQQLTLMQRLFKLLLLLKGRPK